MRRIENPAKGLESRVLEVLDTMLEGVQIVGFDWTYLYVNDAAARNGRFAKDDLLGRRMMDCYPGIERTEMFASLRRSMEDRSASREEFEFTYPDGAVAWFEFDLQPVPEGLFIRSLDITARRDEERRLREYNAQLERRVRERTAELERAVEGWKQVSELKARLAAIVESSDAAIVGRDLDGNITSWNRGAERIFGYTAAEMVGRPVPPLVSVDGEGPELILDDGSGMITPFEGVARRKDGREIVASTIHSPILDDEGRMIGTSTFSRDITDLKRAQAELIQAKNETEAANRELEAFSYSVAHDLRSPLRGIDGFSRALLEDYGDAIDGDGKRFLANIRSSAQRMAQLIDDLLALSRYSRKDMVRDAVNLTALANATLARLKASDPSRRVEVRIEDGLACSGDPHLLAAVLDNLLANAWKFTGKKEVARIEVGSAPVDGRPAFFVRDDGAGFDMAFVGKLFGVFQRLHGATEFEGTGVGLALVERIVRRHDGRVWAEGEPDRGATFFFTLPSPDGT